MLKGLKAELGALLSRRIHELRPEARVLFMSGYVGSGGEVDRLAASEADVLRKPFSRATLNGKLEALLPRPG